jgi:flagellar biosynthesis/type III secretory pathway protein FliH
MANPNIIPAAQAKQLRTIDFKSFDRKPYNYFKDVIADEADAPLAMPRVDVQAVVDTELARERERLKAEFGTEASARFQAGVEDGRRSASAELAAALDLLKQYGSVLSAERAELRKQADQHAIQFAIDIAREIIGVELELRPDAVADAVEHALRSAADASSVTLRVAAEDLQALEAATKKWIGSAGLPAQIELRTDASLKHGDCFIDSAAGTVDARLESQLKHLRDGLLRGAKR